MQAADCEAADHLAIRLGLSGGVRQGLAHVWTRWDGHGGPEVGGQAIALPARVALVANLVEIFNRLGGPTAVVQMVRKRRGADLDPEVSDAFLRAADDLLATIETDSVWDAAPAAEPEPHHKLAGARLDDVAHAFADFADLKSPYVLGHSSAVGRLADAAAQAVGLSDDEVATCCWRRNWVTLD
jgi:HD-GYP domain-containing protein (c-di-GMP phosphodiesterase class II)